MSTEANAGLLRLRGKIETAQQRLIASDPNDRSHLIATRLDVYETCLCWVDDEIRTHAPAPASGRSEPNGADGVSGPPPLKSDSKTPVNAGVSLSPGTEGQGADCSDDCVGCCASCGGSPEAGFRCSTCNNTGHESPVPPEGQGVERGTAHHFASCEETGECVCVVPPEGQYPLAANAREIGGEDPADPPEGQVPEGGVVAAAATALDVAIEGAWSKSFCERVARVVLSSAWPNTDAEAEDEFFATVTGILVDHGVIESPAESEALVDALGDILVEARALATPPASPPVEGEALAITQKALSGALEECAEYADALEAESEQAEALRTWLGLREGLVPTADVIAEMDRLASPGTSSESEGA